LNAKAVGDTMTLPSLPEPARAFTNPGRVIAALLLGAGCGAGLVSGLMVTTALIQQQLGLGLMLAAVAFPIAVVAWLAGLVVVGGPLWWLLRRGKAKPTRLASLLGGVLTPLVVAGPQAVVGLGHDRIDGFDASLAIQIAMFTLFGAVVGWVVARVAYGRQGGAR
jgi:hypothetical protein